MEEVSPSSSAYFDPFMSQRYICERESLMLRSEVFMVIVVIFKSVCACVRASLKKKKKHATQMNSCYLPDVHWSKRRVELVLI